MPDASIYLPPKRCSLISQPQSGRNQHQGNTEHDEPHPARGLPMISSSSRNACARPIMLMPPAISPTTIT